MNLSKLSSLVSRLPRLSSNLFTFLRLFSICCSICCSNMANWSGITFLRRDLGLYSPTILRLFSYENMNLIECLVFVLCTGTDRRTSKPKYNSLDPHLWKRRGVTKENLSFTMSEYFQTYPQVLTKFSQLNQTRTLLSHVYVVAFCGHCQGDKNSKSEVSLQLALVSVHVLPKISDLTCT